VTFVSTRKEDFDILMVCENLNDLKFEAWIPCPVTLTQTLDMTSTYYRTITGHKPKKF